jgi:thiol-disulfide isomerase/thioredoxin
MTRTELSRNLGLTVALIALSILTGAVNWVFQFIVTSIIYFSAGIWIARHEPARRVPPPLLVIGAYLVVYGGHSIYACSVQTYPIWIFGAISFALGWLLGSRVSSTRRMIPYGATFTMVVVTGGFVFMHNWLSYAFNRAATEERSVGNFELLTNERARITSQQLMGKIVVLDFWSTACGACFDKFPEFERFYQRHRSDVNMEIYSVNIPLDGETVQDNDRLIRSLGYSFPTIYVTEGFDEVRSRFGLQGVPTVMVIDVGGTVRYTGSLQAAPYIFVHNLDFQVDALRRERDRS